MKKYLAFTVIECMVSLLCMACTMPLLFALLQHVMYSQQRNAVALLAINELLNYKTIVEVKPDYQDDLLHVWQHEFTNSSDLFVSIVSDEQTCVAAKNNKLGEWCLRGASSA